MKHPDILKQLTLEQKVALLSGKDVWSTYAFPQAGVPSMVMSDGPTACAISWAPRTILVSTRAFRQPAFRLPRPSPALSIPIWFCLWAPLLQTRRSTRRIGCAGAWSQYKAQPFMRA